MSTTVSTSVGARRAVDVTKWLAPLVLFGAFIGAWEMWIAVGHVKQLLLPAPHAIVGQFFDDFSKLAEFARNTFTEAFKGVLIGSLAALAVAALTYRVAWLASALKSYAATLKALPVVALYPICTVFFGITSKAVIAIVAIGIAPIVFAYAVRGFSGSSEQDELMRSISAGFAIRFRMLVLPRSVPYLMAALKTAVPTSIIIAVIAQYFGGRVTTLGSYIRRESANLHTLQMWSAILMSCLLGLACFGAVSLADRLLLRWRAP